MFSKVARQDAFNPEPWVDTKQEPNPSMLILAWGVFLLIVGFILLLVSAVYGSTIGILGLASMVLGLLVAIYGVRTFRHPVPKSNTKTEENGVP